MRATHKAPRLPQEEGVNRVFWGEEGGIESSPSRRNWTRLRLPALAAAIAIAASLLALPGARAQDAEQAQQPDDLIPVELLSLRRVPGDDILLAEVKLDRAPIEDALRAVVSLARQADPDGPEVKATVMGSSLKSVPVTIALADVQVREALAEIAAASGAKLNVSPGGMSFFLTPGSPPRRLPTVPGKAFSGAAEVSLVRFPKLDFRQVTPGEALDHICAASRALDPGAPVASIVVEGNLSRRVFITTSGTNITTDEAIRRVGAIGNFDVIRTDAGFVIRTKPDPTK